MDIFKPGPYELGLDDWRAIKAVAAGTASAHLQQVAFEAIIKRLSRSDDIESFKEGSPDGTAFIQGRAFVGKAIQYIISAEMPEERKS